MYTMRPMSSIGYLYSVRHKLHKEITDRQADRMIKPHRLTSTESSASRQLLTTALSWLMLFYARPAVPRVVVAQCVDTSARVGTVRSAHTRYTAWVTRSPATSKWAWARVLFSHQGWSIFWHGNFRPHRTRCVDAGYCYPRVWCSVVCICALDTSTSCAKIDERIVSRFGEQTHKIQRRCGLLLNYFGCLFYFSGSWMSFVGIMLRNSPSSSRTAFTTM